MFGLLYYKFRNSNCSSLLWCCKVWNSNQYLGIFPTKQRHLIQIMLKFHKLIKNNRLFFVYYSSEMQMAISVFALIPIEHSVYLLEGD